MEMQDVSSDFTTDAANGTEYIQVGMQLSLEMLLPPAANDKNFEGEVWAVTTLDPERYPLNGKSAVEINTAAMDENSSYSCSIYGINPNGSFYFKRDSKGRTGSGGSLATLKLIAVPVSTGAYKWQRIGATATVGTGTTANGAATTGFIINAPSGTSYRTMYTSVYQTEKYPSALVRAHKPAYGSSPVGDLQGIINGLVSSPGVTSVMNGGLSAPHVSGASVLDHYKGSQPGFGQQVIAGGKKVISGLVNSGLLNTLWKAFTADGSTVANLPAIEGGTNWVEGAPPQIGGSSWVEEVEEVGEDLLPLLEAA